MPKTKPYTAPLEADLAKQLLNSSGTKVGDQLLGDALHEAAEHLAGLVEQATAYLDDSEFSEMVAEHLAKKANRRGAAEIQVSERGRLILNVSYDEDHRAKGNSKLIPKMAELRKMAAELGVDIEPFGIKRRMIFEHLKKVKGGSAKGAKKKSSSGSKQAKKTIKKEIKQANDAPEEEPGPMSAGVDETRVSPMPDEPKPPKKKKKGGFVKTSQAVSTPVVVHMDKPDPGPEEEIVAPKKASKLQKLVTESKEVDINDLLNSDTPE
jgi:hypothetical protein